MSLVAIFSPNLPPIAFDSFHDTPLHLSALTRISFLAMIPLARSSSSIFFTLLFSRPITPFLSLSLSYSLFFLSSLSFYLFFSSPRLLHHLRVLQRRPISRYPLTWRRFFTRATPCPSSLVLRLRAPFLLSEGHWNRIKLYAGFSMPLFPPVAMKAGYIRHGGRSCREMVRSRLNEVKQNFFCLLSDVYISKCRWRSGRRLATVPSGRDSCNKLDRQRVSRGDKKEPFSGRRGTVVFFARVYPER